MICLMIMLLTSRGYYINSVRYACVRLRWAVLIRVLALEAAPCCNIWATIRFQESLSGYQQSGTPSQGQTENSFFEEACNIFKENMI